MNRAAGPDPWDDPSRPDHNPWAAPGQRGQDAGRVGPTHGSPAGRGGDGWQQSRPQPVSHHDRAFTPGHGDRPLKSKWIAGLLQIFLGGLGAGRFYIGSTVIALAQLGGTLLCLLLMAGFITVFLASDDPGTAGVATFGFGIGWYGIQAVALWALTDGILMMAGLVKDGRGRRLGPAPAAGHERDAWDRDPGSSWNRDDASTWDRGSATPRERPGGTSPWGDQR